MNDICTSTIAELSDRIRRKALSPVEITAAFLERIAAVNPLLDCFITVTAEHAMSAAREAQAEIMAGRWRGPLHGVPYALKDIYETAGIRTTGHSRILADSVPREDATTVRRLKNAGAVLLGKLATHELANGGPSLDLPWPPARNPWNPLCITGGSSTGSAAAIAAALVPGALGSDTGGSIRMPANLCGVAGLKPTAGLVSRHGVIPNSYALDTCGPMAWTAEDCAILLTALEGYDPEDPCSVEYPARDYRALLEPGLHGLRIGVVRHWSHEEMPSQPVVRAAFDRALATLKALGATLTDVRLRSLQSFHDVRSLISLSELLCVHQGDFACRPQDFSDEFFQRITAYLYTSVDYVHAQRERSVILQEMQAVYASCDVLVTVGANPAARYDATVTDREWLAAMDFIYTPFNVTGGPALAVCTGFTDDGLPVGMQIAGAPFADDVVLRVGYAYEQATEWRKRRPPEPKEKPPLTAPPNTRLPPAPPLSAEQREHVATLARRAGFNLSAQQLEHLERAAAHTLARAARVPRDQAREVPLASVFRF